MKAINNYFLTDEKQEAFNAVSKLNNELYEKYSKPDKKNQFGYNRLDELPIVSITFAAQYMLINLSIPSEIDLPEINLYNSENNNRIYYEKSDKYETFYKYLKRRFLEVKKEINSVKL